MNPSGIVTGLSIVETQQWHSCSPMVHWGNLIDIRWFRCGDFSTSVIWFKEEVGKFHASNAKLDPKIPVVCEPEGLFTVYSQKSRGRWHVCNAKRSLLEPLHTLLHTLNPASLPHHWLHKKLCSWVVLEAF